MEVLQDLVQAKTLQDLILAYTLELSTATHSVIIGVNLGLITGDDQYTALTSYLCALCFHQFAEGVGVGNVIQSVRESLGTFKVILFIFIFSFTISMGVIIGIGKASDDPSDSQLVAKGSVTAIAAGALLFTSLAEMTARYFNNHLLDDSSYVKMGMLGSYCFGLGVMALIGYWA